MGIFKSIATGIAGTASGGAIGFAVGGPIGAIVGSLVGSAVADSRNESREAGAAQMRYTDMMGASASMQTNRRNIARIQAQMNQTRTRR